MWLAEQKLLMEMDKGESSGCEIKGCGSSVRRCERC